MKKCPFCAEEIQDAAIKCKHCGESVVAKSESPAQQPKVRLSSSTLVNLYFMGICTIVGCVLMYLISTKVAPNRAWVMVTLFAVGGPLGWIAGEIFRRIAHPSWVMGRGAIDLFMQRIFWWIGPQITGMGIIFVAILYLLGLMPSNAASSANPVNVRQSEALSHEESPAPSNAERSGALSENDLLLVTKHGRLEVSEDPNSRGRNDKLIWNGDIVADVGGYHVSASKRFMVRNDEVLLLTFNGGGSSSPNEYAFLITRPSGNADFVAEDGMYSDDGTFDIVQNGDVIEMDLGYSEGKKKSAILSGTTLTLGWEDVDGKVPLNAASCRSLYEALEYCADADITTDKGCADGGRMLPNAVNDAYWSAQQRPGFNTAAFDALCNKGCVSGKAVSEKVFARDFCE